MAEVGSSTCEDVRESPKKHDAILLIVKIDGVLVRTNVVLEYVFAKAGRFPEGLGELLGLLTKGGRTPTHFALQAVAQDFPTLLFDPYALDLIERARLDGRPVRLVSSNGLEYSNAIAARIGIVNSNDERSGQSSQYRESRETANVYDYVGNSVDDLPAWRNARHRIAVGADNDAINALRVIDPQATVVRRAPAGLFTWLRLLRVHQWIKNALLFLPLLTSHKFNFWSFGQASLAFVAFCLAASGVYIFNDLIDLDADRRHPVKKSRPLAAGELSIEASAWPALSLVLFALAVSTKVGLPFLLVTLSYIVLSLAYTVFLKRKMLVDVFALALLYSVRVIAGAVAIEIDPSEWLIAFSMFLFTSLALIKRYVELAARLDGDLPEMLNRNYRKTDLGIVATLAAAAGFDAVVVFSLYVSSDTVHQLYRRPQMLWLICPILMYWLSRALMMAHRRLMHDDPIVFALRDWNSLVALTFIVTILLAAI